MRSFYYNRKGQTQLGINSLGVIAVTILVAAVILGLGGTILEKIQDTQTDNSATTANNESITWPGNNTVYTLVENRVSGGETVWNATDKMVSGVDYNLVGNALTFTNESNASWLTDKLNITYNYNYGSIARNSSNFGLEGVATFAEFIPTIALIAVAAIVIGIVLVMFGRKRKEE